jgi:RNA-directed DNA polymerase
VSSFLRYQDDIVILCKTKRQMNRCRRRMMQILHERQLRLSRKKSRMGTIDKGFHFLGIDYPPTQPADNTNRAQAKNAFAARSCVAQLSPTMGGGRPFLRIRCLSQYALFHIREQCGKHASKSSRWSTMDSLSNRSDAICIALSFGG